MSITPNYLIKNNYALSSLKIYCCFKVKHIIYCLKIILISLIIIASMRLCMGSRRGFICRMKIGNSGGMMASISGHNLHQRLKQRNTLGPTRDGNEFAVIHCTGYIKNWPPTGQFDHPLSGMMSICRLITSMTLTNYLN